MTAEKSVCFTSCKEALAGLVSFWRLTIDTNRLIWCECRKLILARHAVVMALVISRIFQSAVVALFVNHILSATGTSSSLFSTSTLVAGLILLTGLPLFLQTIQNFLYRLLWFRLDEKLGLALNKKLAELDIATHEDPKLKDLFYRAIDRGVWKTSETINRQNFILQHSLNVIFAITVLSISNWFIFLLLLVGTIPEFIAEIRFGKQVWGIWDGSTETQRRYWDIRHRFSQVSEVIEQRVFGSSNHMLNIFRGLYLDFQDRERKAETRRLTGLLGAQVSSLTVLGIATSYFAYQAMSGEIQPGTFIFVFGAMSTLRSSLSDLFMNLALQFQDKPFVENLFELLRLPPRLTQLNPALNPFTNDPPEIIFENVSFHYPGTSGDILKGVSFRLAPREKIAIVGANGAGKTTLMKLLCRFYDPSEGRILLNGVDLRDIEISTWYDQLGILFQEYARYKFTIAETIHLGRINTTIDPALISNAADRSGVSEFAKSYEHGLNQMLGREFSDGVEPSVGQWQKLALARLFYRNPKILVLDEPTASIDAEAEENIFESLASLAQNQSVIVISHRFSTVRRSDRILVLGSGRVIEQGTHEELLAKAGDYARLFRMQAKGYQ